ncbi:MAG: GNAT family N-acetyltransferase [Proteobacteria bacterium]|nr:GNAT family N-acetyltransferase [Pseudomonadota bacterium]
MQQPPSSFVIRAALLQDMALVASLFREYAGGIGIDLSYQGFEAELAALPGAYAPPRGVILLAEQNGAAAGCVAVRPFGDGGICEMKRLHVRDTARGQGLGRALAMAAIAAARKLGYATMRLDTLSTMIAAQSLYRTLGFRPIAPYYATPVAGTVFMEKTLAPANEG